MGARGPNPPRVVGGGYGWTGAALTFSRTYNADDGRTAEQWARAEAESITGPLADDTWAKIEAAAKRLAVERAELEASTAAGFNSRRGKLAKRLRDALDLLALDEGDRRLIAEAADLYSLDRPGAPEATGPHAPAAAVATATDAILTALMVIERAEVQTIAHAAPGKAGADFARSVRAALAAAGFDVRISYGGELQGQFGAKASEADLTPFEQLLSLLGAHAAETPDAFARWVRAAMAGEN